MKQRLNANAQAVLEAVREVAGHPSALEIYEEVKRKRPRIGLASVYRILHNLSEQGYIGELGRSDDSSRYDARTDRHDHAVCINCGTLIDVPVEVTLSQESLKQAAQSVGLELSSYEVRLYGRCLSCQVATRVGT